MKILVIASDKAELRCFSDDYIKVVSGVGPVLSAVAASYAIDQHRPDIVFSVGSAGSYGRLRVGECISFGSVVSPDQDLSFFRMKRGNTILPSGGTIGELMLDRNSSFILSTSGSFASTASSIPADAADMEAYGVAMAAYMKSIPCFAVKVITDIVGEKITLGDYGFSLRQLRSLLPDAVKRVVSAL